MSDIHCQAGIEVSLVEMENIQVFLMFCCCLVEQAKDGCGITSKRGTSNTILPAKKHDANV